MKMLLACLLLTASVFAQDSPQPDRWRGLILNETTPAQAIERLGPPKEDRTDRLRIFQIPKQWLSKRVETKGFRLLTWKNLDGIDEVTAAFEGERLVLLVLDPKEEPAAAALGSIYGVSLFPQVSGSQEAAFPADFERNQGRVYPKTYPTVFGLLGTAEHSFVGALVGNVGFGAVLKNSTGVRDTAIPGKVKRIELVSRTLENKDGADALK